MLYNLLKKRSNNVEFQNIALEAMIEWIYHYLPQINCTPTPSTAKIIKLSATLLQIQVFRIHSQRIDNVSNSHALSYFVLHQIVQRNPNNQRAMKASTLSDIKCILSHTIGKRNGCNEDNVCTVLQVIESVRIKATKQEQCAPDIDKIINICYAIAMHHHPSSRIGSKLLRIADNGCFKALFDKLPKKYKQFRNGKVVSIERESVEHKEAQIQMYQNQLSSVLENRSRAPSFFMGSSSCHPMRAFGGGSIDLNDSFNDISLDINRNKKQIENRRAHSVPAAQSNYLCSNRPRIKIRCKEPNDDDHKEQVNNDELLCDVNDNNSYSDKENAAKNNKMSGNKRKRDANQDNSNNNAQIVAHRPSPAKKAKRDK